MAGEGLDLGAAEFHLAPFLPPDFDGSTAGLNGDGPGGGYHGDGGSGGGAGDLPSLGSQTPIQTHTSNYSQYTSNYSSSTYAGGGGQNGDGSGGGGTAGGNGNGGGFLHSYLHTAGLGDVPKSEVIHSSFGIRGAFGLVGGGEIYEGGKGGGAGGGWREEDRWGDLGLGAAD